MSTFMALAIGILIGAVLGGMGMFYLIKETRMDLNIEEDSIDIENPWDTEELEMPKEVKYGEF